MDSSNSLTERGAKFAMEEWTDGPQNSTENSMKYEEGDRFNYLTGWRSHVTMAALGLALFLANLELTIIGTALVSITNDLHDFVKASWVVTAYLITYTSGLVIWAKISDHLGRKPIYIICLIMFSAFAGGSGASQTMIQLIVCRAFQGLGAGGVYAVAVVMLYELKPPNKLPQIAAVSAGAVALGNALGPVFGGLISQGSTWRWVFLLNVPSGAVAAIVVFFVVPNDYPYQGLRRQRQQTNFKAIDFTGTFLMLAALALLISGLEQAAILLYWTSATVIAPICVSVVVWLAFFGSQWYFSRPGSLTEPVFPWRFLENREIIGLLVNSFMTGSVSVTCIIQLPIRYQTTVGASPLQAGVRLLPFVMCGPIGVTLVAMLSKKRRVPPIYIGLVGSIFQMLGLIFMARGPPNNPDWTPLYGLEVLTGMGMGISIGFVTLLTPYIAEKRDLAVASAAGTQFRFLGSALVVSITTAVGNGWIKDQLSSYLTSSQIEQIFQTTATIDKLPEQLQPSVRSTFVRGFNLQMHIVLGFAVASVFSIALMWRRSQIRVD
ncbi:putative multidrug resistance protein fnx1 [Annulohypoxylon truncatum]|uniref:putative multidrug resistance protein fnx1 n=1 Tax=Annulohypoxylon truncatum TaxID=327061 RepID=UPI002008C9C9|nr:putative multidrug resistance protein fnx1 [Annulohypoxylon truncatum]KAI1205341.1 putative multidrug resistance protein fnx1 [Annulohypoxylon truncatum]